MGLRVIGSGLGRTGTNSLQLALEWLGFGPCHHMTDVLADSRRALMWIDAFEGRADWEAIFEGYGSVVDAPGCRFWRELAEHYPRAQVLHSVRDADEWFDSTQTSVFAPDSRSLNPEPPYDRFFEHNLRPYRGHIHDRSFMTGYFRRHGAEVERTIPKPAEPEPTRFDPISLL